MQIYVSIPFSDAFDDVFYIIRDATSAVAQQSSIKIELYRADEIEQPGRISEAILQRIRDADIIISDITGANANVMYELGYCHALQKATVILSQSVHDSPFDIKDFRQIVYDRTRLLRDCRPRLISAIASVVEQRESPNSTSPSPLLASSMEVHAGLPPASAPMLRRPGPRLLAELQEVYLELRLARQRGSLNEAAVLGARLRSILDTISVINRTENDDTRAAAGVIGNSAVELEQLEELELAESIFTRAIAIFPRYVGLRIQYADFLFDRGNESEAQLELKAAKELDASDRRIPRLELKFSVSGGRPDPEVGESLRQRFISDPGNSELAVPYLVYVTQSNGDREAFVSACRLWEQHLPDGEKITAKRALADYLATQDDDEAIVLFEEIVDNVSNETSIRHGAAHNLATMYARRKNKDAAIRYWRIAYSLMPNDATVRSAFSHFLSSADDVENARRVMKGETLSPEVSQETPPK